MRAAKRIVLCLCVLAAVGCGTKSDPKPAAAERQTSDVERFAQQTNEALRKQSDRVRDDWNRVNDKADQAIRDARGQVDGLVNDAERKRAEMEAFAARMAEDAKDRVLDIPDAIDEFFGAPPQGREGRRSSRGGKKRP